jgi:hypothetical protein
MVLNVQAMDAITYDAGSKVLRVGAGAHWGDVLLFQVGKGRSAAIMPLYGDLSIGGSLARNCQGAAKF